LFIVLRPDEPGGTAADAPREQTIRLAVECSAMHPDEVGEGDRVKLVLTSEEPVEVHLHGYDLERDRAWGADYALV
jgi:hypothetical protein